MTITVPGVWQCFWSRVSGEALAGQFHQGEGWGLWAPGGQGLSGTQQKAVPANTTQVTTMPRLAGSSLWRQVHQQGRDMGAGTAVPPRGGPHKPSSVICVGWKHTSFAMGSLVVTSAQIRQPYWILPRFCGPTPAPSVLEALPDFQAPLIHRLLILANGGRG